MSSVNVETEQPITSSCDASGRRGGGADSLLTTIIKEIQLTGRSVTHKLTLWYCLSAYNRT
ncbi:MAG: hypothetical protein GPOALKHO_001234 [Sodalis sp.]|uniref:hypothetical protein n=1 Tax=Sodalis sp. (in: enterobacteria) TaxID=1898979 RepID=UPI0038737F29|nr:MAG: hypothetical protein GPOALKHO_001234 [Sodalis sp.]